MSLQVISKENGEKESKVLNKIFSHINKKESFIFNSGAGAGKTYALIESLKYVIESFNKELKNNNQKIMCITYTNIASQEVKERLGNTSLVVVSTIHERMWDLIKGYQKELVEIHKNHLENESNKLIELIDTDKKYNQYKILTEDKKANLKSLMIENRELFFEHYNSSAAEFKNYFSEILKEYPEILKNAQNFKKITNALFNIEKYSTCIQNIESKKNEYRSIEYTPKYNRDMLHEMKISHDTLLEYSLEIINKYDLFKHFIIDQYPFVFIDEYQDTDEKIIRIMNYLDRYSNEIKHNWIVGYFGDSAQSIYEGGIGGSINDFHQNLNIVNKEFNRRSTQEVIEVINKFRSDNIEQNSIYEDCTGGSVGFSSETKEDVQNYLDKYIEQWKVSEKNKLHCLVLTNELVAEYSGFKNIYSSFKKCKRYSGMNYSQLNTELLNNDEDKLGKIQRLLFNIIQLFCIISNDKSSLIELFPKSKIYKDMNIRDLRNLILQLRQTKVGSLGNCIENIEVNYSEGNNREYNEIMDWIFGFKNITRAKFKNYLIQELFKDLSDDDDDESKNANEVIEELLKINVSEFEFWYKFVTNTQEEKVVYHTYHGTKGLEFENVIIIMENKFGREKNYFDFYFKNYMNEENLECKDLKKYEKIQNLLYVSCSRAIKNLRILYLDNIDGFEDNIKKIFGQILNISEDNK